MSRPLLIVLVSCLLSLFGHGTSMAQNDNVATLAIAAAEQAETDLSGLPAPTITATVTERRFEGPGDRVLDQIAQGGTMERIILSAKSPFGAPRTWTFFVFADRDPIQVVPSMPGQTRTRPYTQMELAPAVQLAAVTRAGVTDTCNRDRDMPVIDTIGTPVNPDGSWEEIWKVRLCNGAIEWITVRFDPPVFGREPSWSVLP